MPDRSKPDQIVYIRRLIMETLGVGRAIAMRGQAIFNIVCVQVETTYDAGLFEKDLLYLANREFIRINEALSGKRAKSFASRDIGPRWFMKVYWELTPAGSDIASNITTDASLE